MGASFLSVSSSLSPTVVAATTTMGDVALPTPKSKADAIATPEIQAQDSATEVPTSTIAAEKTKGRGLRALRDRIALRRSYSAKHTSLSLPNLESPEVEHSSDALQDTVSPKSPKSHPFGRLLNNKLGIKKGTGGKQSKDGTASADAVPIAVSLDPAPSNSSESSPSGGDEALPAIAETEAAIGAVESVVGAVPTTDPEPLSLARKVHSLLSSLPPFLSTFDPPSGSDGSPPKDGAPKDGSSSTTPDPPSSIPDSRVISLLMSPTFMNGSLTRGRQSVWAMLDNIRLKSLKSDTGTAATSESTPLDHLDLVEDNDSVMFYAPLLPDETSSVELARSEIVSVDENGKILEVLVDDAPHWNSSVGSRTAIEAFKWHWPWQRDPPPPTKPKTIEKRVWVPSATKLSLQVMWWGYRLWLPPPVLAKLNDKEIEAAKLGAIVTTALTWLLNNVPESALPATLRPALMLVKSLVPYLGYIGGFVAWSWGAIKGFDVGHGVTLTATWLLPIALIPGSWADEDVPKPPAPSDPPAPPPKPSPSPPTNPSPPPSDSSPPPPTIPPSNPSVPPSNPSTSNPPVAGSDPSPPPDGPATDPIPPTGPSVL